MRDAVKSLVMWGLRLPHAGAAFAPLMRDRATVFMLHRFREPGGPDRGEDPQALRRVLGHLRKERYALMDLEDLVARLKGEGTIPARAVAFTIDDGYADHAEIAAPVFREFDCPVTTFVTTGFLDHDLWFWWDQIEYVFVHTPRHSLRLPAEDGPDVPLSSPGHRRRAQASFTEWCKRIPDAEKHREIRGLAERAEVDIPAECPPEYAPMSWDQLRRCEDGGMRFGPHTRTHPILTMVPDDQARDEIHGSWKRLQDEAADPVPVFCYPNGQADDYGPREIDLLREAGLDGAVVGRPGHVSREALRDDLDAAYQLPRFSFDSEIGKVVQYASGLERFLDFLRPNAH